MVRLGPIANVGDVGGETSYGKGCKLLETRTSGSRLIAVKMGKLPDQTKVQSGRHVESKGACFHPG